MGGRGRTKAQRHGANLPKVTNSPKAEINPGHQMPMALPASLHGWDGEELWGEKLWGGWGGAMGGLEEGTVLCTEAAE